MTYVWSGFGMSYVFTISHRIQIKFNVTEQTSQKWNESSVQGSSVHADECRGIKLQHLNSSFLPIVAQISPAERLGGATRCCQNQKLKVQTIPTNQTSSCCLVFEALRGFSVNSSGLSWTVKLSFCISFSVRRCIRSCFQPAASYKWLRLPSRFWKSHAKTWILERHLEAAAATVNTCFSFSLYISLLPLSLFFLPLSLSQPQPQITPPTPSSDLLTSIDILHLPCRSSLASP